MTEEDAKLKWCPMVKYDLGRAVNRDACYDNAGTHCIGSACMMWRTDIKRYPATRVDETTIVGQGMSVNHYCGLGGKP